MPLSRGLFACNVNGPLRRSDGTSHHLRHGIATPNAEQQYFCPRRVLEHVKDIRNAFNFVKTGPPRIWPRRRSHCQKLPQFRELFLRMVSQIFHKGRSFLDCEIHFHSPPHSAYLLLSCKDVKTLRMFRHPQRFFLSNWPALELPPVGPLSLLRNDNF